MHEGAGRGRNLHLGEYWYRNMNGQPDDQEQQAEEEVEGKPGDPAYQGGVPADTPDPPATGE